MSEPQADPATALLARKGLAAPVGAVSSAVQAPASGAAPALFPVSESLPEVVTPVRAGAPAASLLPFDFLAGRQGAPDLAPRPPDPPEAAVVPTGDPASVATDVPMAEAEAKGAGETAAPAQAEAKPAPSGDPGPELSAPPELSAKPELSARPEVPRPDPALRPALRPALHMDAGAGPAPRAEPRRFPALAAGLALALVLGAAGYGYQSGWLVSQPPERSPAAAARTPAPTQPGRIQPEAANPEAANPEAMDTVLAPAGTPAESLPAAPSVPESDPPAGADPPSEAGRPAVPEPPSVDVVRIEPGGAAVIAGRAAPGTELILLDNGAPIGTVTADAYGEWVFISTSPLPRGAHDFGLVIKEVRGGVRVPAPGQAPAKQDAAQDTAAPGVSGINEPGTVAGAAATVPIPPRKPDTGTTDAAPKRAAGAPSPAFVIQLASVKSRSGAQREWRALRKRFPAILSRMSLSLDEARLAGGATVVRLRTGAFPKHAEAAALCARLAAKHQDCLVVRAAAHH